MLSRTEIVEHNHVPDVLRRDRELSFISDDPKESVRQRDRDRGKKFSGYVG